MKCYGGKKTEGELATHFCRSHEALMDRRLLPVIDEIYENAVAPVPDDQR